MLVDMENICKMSSDKTLTKPMNLLEFLNFPLIISIRNWKNVTNLLVNYKNELWMMVLVSKIENDGST